MSLILCTLATAASVLGLAACASGGAARYAEQTTTSNAPSGSAARPVRDGLPALTALEGQSHAVSAVGSLSGADFSRSAGPQALDGTSLQLTPGTDELSYGIYSFTVPHGAQLASVSIDCSAAEPQQFWIGLSDYSAGNWKIAPLLSDSASLTVDRPAEDLSSDSCLMHVAVLAYGSALTVNSVSIQHNGETLNWAHSWGTSASEDGRFCGMDAEGNLYVSIDSEALSDEVTPSILKFSQDGTLLVARQWTDPELFGSQLGIREMLVNAAGDVYLAYTAGSSRKAFIMKADSDLNTVWCRRWDTAGTESVGGLGFDADGNLVVHVVVSNDVLSDPDDYGALVWLSPDGNLVRELQHNWAVASHRPLYRRIISEPTTGDLLLVGHRSAFDPPSMGTPSLLRLDSTGQVLFDKYLDSSLSFSLTFSENGVAYDEAGNMVSASAVPRQDVSSFDDGVLLVRSDRSGALLSAQKLLTPRSSVSLETRLMTERFTNGDLLVQTRSDAGEGTESGFIRLSRVDASPQEWLTFGVLYFSFLEDCGSFFCLGDALTLADAQPTINRGTDLTTEDYSGIVSLVDSGDTLTVLTQSQLIDQSASELVDAAGDLDLFETAASSEALIARTVPLD
ncbi:hypothetical protein IT575_03540 [bacterium]|nr:hypothetical protein [bacterium]